MQRPTERAGSSYPLVRVFTLGDFALERLAAAPTTQGGQPRYEPLAPQAWASRGPAMTLLKVLLCRPGRRASRGELTAAIWPGGPAIDADHALDSAASVLRRHVLAVPEGGSLLLTLRSGGETLLKLPGQRRLWVDADALLEMVSAGLRAELLGQSPLPPLEMALALARGEFLEDDLYAEWSQGRRHTVSGARRRALYRLVRLYQQEGRGELAEELLFTALEQDPTDEDALCRLMVLLVEQGRRQEALQLYQYSLDVLREEGSEPASYTRELAQRTRRGHVLRERGEGYGSLATGTQASGRGRCWIGGQWAGRRGYSSRSVIPGGEPTSSAIGGLGFRKEVRRVPEQTAVLNGHVRAIPWLSSSMAYLRPWSVHSTNASRRSAFWTGMTASSVEPDAGAEHVGPEASERMAEA